ncbi:MAG: kelch motif-containing protein [Bacteroidales bacterium]|nr:kelch motif-containing protein [Bacteroidales bacterium]
MKAKYIYPCLMALAITSGCIKDQGEEALLITREVKDKSDKKEDPLTILTGYKGYMYGEAYIDEVIDNSFATKMSENRIEELDCYVTLSSKFEKIDVSKNKIVEAGYVYSRNVPEPLVGAKDCSVFEKKNVNFRETDGENDEFSFTGSGHSLDFNVKYYMRSYLVSEKGDTIYNPRVVEVKTKLPEDVWFRRKDASLSRRFDCIQFYVDDQIYIYGGRDASTCYNDLWTYDKKSDTWKQMKSFLDTDNSKYAGLTKRSNGAAFIYKTKNDKLVFIGGGELSNGQPTASVFYYSTQNNRYATAGDHPNFSEKVPLFDEKGNPVYITKNGKAVYQKDMDKYPIYKTDKDGNPTDEIEDEIWVDENTKKPKQFTVNASDGSVADLPQPLRGLVGFSMDGIAGECHYFGLGKNDMNTPVSICYEYLMRNDRTNTNDPNIPNRVITWTESTFSIKGQRTGENLYEPICIEVRGLDEEQGKNTKVIIGTGENENGVSKNFYQIQKLNDNSVDVQPLPAVPEGFVGRANATAFYLNFTKEDGTHINRMYVGTGRNCKEESTTISSLLNDFWCYDFNTTTWMPRANCSNIYRQGACGFALERTDDYFASQFGGNQRGFVSFGEGFVFGSGETNMTPLNDNWEYLP